MHGGFDLDPAQWATLRRLLDTALALVPQERQTWVESLAPEHDQLKPRLRRLLAHAEATGGSPLDTLPRVETLQFATGPARADDEAPQAGDAVGPYRLVRRLGEGGMGAVWLAERTDMLHRRQVALKLPRVALSRSALSERLLREREILAGLNHPNIARLYDAGLDAAGRPYLALEYVEGERIDTYCERRRLDTSARLRLFLQVAHAVAHAHANLVVHRDLKPANVLVTEAGDVRLLDFGIAKLLEAGSSAQETELTQLAGRALTPEYAAPEQVLGQPIGTAADVYALGVVLFELLTGTRPYRLKRGSRAALEEAIVHGEPARPSAVVTETKLRRRLQGDLDTIVLKALKKEPAQRYGTVEALAADIERHLRREPVLAQPDSRLYRLRKFVARNVLAVGASAAVLVAVVGGAGVALWQARQARAEQQRAEEVKAFIASIFRDADPGAGPQNKPSAADLLQRARGRLGERFADVPSIRIELLNVIGESLAGLQEFGSAEQILREANALAERELAPGHPQRVRARYLLARTYADGAQFRPLKAELAALVPLLERAPDRFAEEFGDSLRWQALVALHEGRADEHLALAQRALALAQAKLGPDHPLRLLALRDVAAAHENRRNAAEAERVSQQAYELSERIYHDRPAHPQRFETRFVHARILHLAGKTAAALPLMRQSLADAEALFGPASLRVGTILNTMVASLIATDRLDEALDASRRSVAILERHHAPDSIQVAYALVPRASIQRAMRRPQAALEDYDRAYRILRAAIGDDKHYVLHVRGNRAQALADAGNTARATEELVQVIEGYRRHGYAQVGVMWLAYAYALRLDGRPEQALQVLHDNAASMSTPAERSRLHVERGLTLLAVDQPEPALEDLNAAKSIFATGGAPPAPQRMEIELGVGRALLALGRTEPALSAARAVDSFWRGFQPESRWAGEAAFWLARCHAALREAVEAREAYARAARILARSPLAKDATLREAAARGARDLRAASR
jgi:serine/threonine-protein kinase